jgi:phospholipase C
MNGFDLLTGAKPATGPDDYLPFVYYPRERIPNYYKLAESFVLCDHFFSTTLGPTFPGHLATIAAQSPAAENPSCATCTSAFEWGCGAPPSTRVFTFDPVTCAGSSTFPCFDIPVVTDALPRGFQWRAYGPVLGGAILTPFQAVKSVGADTAARNAHFRDQAKVVADLARGDQANVTYINVSAGEFSEHPPQDPCDGENFTVAIVNALMNGPHWSESALVITWDDWGGLYDHVVPLVNQKSAECAGNFFNTGFRVPALIVSPYAKRGYIKKGGAEQASIPRLIEELFAIQPMNARDPNARDTLAGTLLDAFDFDSPARAPEPLTPRTCP